VFQAPASQQPLSVLVDCANGVGSRALTGFAALPQLAACKVELRGSNVTPQPGAVRHTICVYILIFSYVCSLGV
jgi:hypothetical protein